MCVRTRLGNMIVAGVGQLDPWLWSMCACLLRLHTFRFASFFCLISESSGCVSFVERHHQWPRPKSSRPRCVWERGGAYVCVCMGCMDTMNRTATLDDNLHSHEHEGMGFESTWGTIWYGRFRKDDQFYCGWRRVRTSQVRYSFLNKKK